MRLRLVIEIPQTRHGVYFREDILAHDYDDAAIARAVREHELIRVGTGAYAAAKDRYPDELHRMKAIAAWLGDVRAGNGDPGGVLSHISAAVVLGLDTLHPTLGRVHFTKPNSSGNIRANRHTHSALLRADEVTFVDGIMVTNLERTAVDIACVSKFPAALAVVDAALRRGADREVMRSTLARVRRNGIRTARRAIESGSPLAESVGESWSRSQMITAGLRLPELQRSYDIRGNRWRVDFDWNGRLVGEFDGIKKYTKLLREGEESSDVVIREKLREDALTASGIKVLRWVFDDLRPGNVLVPMLSAQLDKLPKVL